MDDAIVPAQEIALKIYNITGLRRTGMQFFDYSGIVAIRHKANVLTVRFIRHAQPVFNGQSTGFGFGREMPKREA